MEGLLINHISGKINLLSFELLTQSLHNNTRSLYTCQWNDYLFICLVDKKIIFFAGPGDYIMHSELFTFSPTLSDFTATIMIVDDSALESAESFTVRAELISPDAPGVNIAPEQSTVTILDTDSEFCV